MVRLDLMYRTGRRARVQIKRIDDIYPAALRTSSALDYVNSIYYSDELLLRRKMGFVENRDLRSVAEEESVVA